MTPIAIVCLAFSAVIVALSIFVCLYATKPHRAADERTDSLWVKQETENQRLREMVAKLHELLIAKRASESRQGPTPAQVAAISNGVSQPHPPQTRVGRTRQSAASIGVDENLEGG